MRIRLNIMLAAAGGLLAAIPAYGQVEIHRCATDDGSIVYQQLPCAVEQDPAAGDEQTALETPPEPTVNSEITFPDDEQDQEIEAREQRDADEIAACRQQYRDAIDRIDAEIREGIASDELEKYRERARALSQALSRC